MDDRAERRLGQALAEALELACRQRDIDVARDLEAILLRVIARRPAGVPERRRQWVARVANARAALRALEASMRRDPRDRAKGRAA